MKTLIIILSLLISPIVNAKIINNEPIWPKPPSSVSVNFSMDRLAAIILTCNSTQELGIFIGLPPRITRNFKAGAIEELTLTFTDDNGKVSKHTLMFRVGQNNLLYRQSSAPALLNSVQMMTKNAYLTISYQWFSQDFELDSNRNIIHSIQNACSTVKMK